MSGFEVEAPILNSPFQEPREHWLIVEGAVARRLPGRRPASYFFRQATRREDAEAQAGAGTEIELKLVNRIRERVKTWCAAGHPGVTRTTNDLLHYWHRDGRQHRLFFAQIEAAETVIFLVEARADFRQGIDVPLDELSEERQAAGFRAFRRLACKMATGSGKTTVMGMLAAWSILNKLADRSDGRFSDVVLVVCPNVTIRNRLRELDPKEGEASLYRTRDLVPPHLLPRLADGRVLTTNWHVFEPQSVQTSGVSARVTKAGVALRTKETIWIGPKTTTARGRRYLTPDELERQTSAKLISVIEEQRDRQGNLKKVLVESVRYVESDTALVNRVLGREVGGKQNILVMNDEAHHAYRIWRPELDELESDEADDDEDVDEYFVREATVWVEGLDRIQKLRGINFCVDLSATPYYLGRMGADTNRIFPWVVSEFGLTDAIESGLVKIPQLAVRDTTGAAIPGYFNIWSWILPKLTPAERGGKKGAAKPEAILKWANTPIAMLAGLWEQERLKWASERNDPRPPVFIIVCKNTKIAKLVYEWLGENEPPLGIPPAHIEGFRNTSDRKYTIRVDSKVVHETDTGQPKSDESAWMRVTLDTVGKLDWPRDRLGRQLMPDGFEELARKLKRPLHLPGRDVRCIVSVGMLTEGWDCNPVTHIVGLRPFMSQLLCEQVVGRGLRRSSYDVDENDRLGEEVAKVFGVPFEVIPFKATQGAKAPAPPKHHVYAVPEKATYEIRFPRVEGYHQAIRNRIAIDRDGVASLVLDPGKIPPEVEAKAGLPTNLGRPQLTGPGRLERIDLSPFRAGRRLQELVFELARDLTRTYVDQPKCEAPTHVLFPQIARIVEWYLRERVKPLPPANMLDVFLSPYYGWVIERLVAAIHPDASQGEAPEIPRYETSRGPGSTAEVEFWTRRDVREVLHSHVNYVVADTLRWEQSAAYALDTHSLVDAFVKNAGLGFAIPYLDNGESHDYVPDFIVRLNTEPQRHLILETKGYDEKEEVKREAAARWVAAVNAEGSFGPWAYEVSKRPSDVRALLDRLAASERRAAP